MPSINYLQRLGPEYLDLVFTYSRWIFEQDPDIAFEVGLSCCGVPYGLPIYVNTTDFYFGGGGASSQSCR